MKKYLNIFTYILSICIISQFAISQTTKESTLRKELPEKRTHYSKTYINEDNSDTLEISAGPVHFRNDADEWQEINRNVGVTEPKISGHQVIYTNAFEP